MGELTEETPLNSVILVPGVRTLLDFYHLDFFQDLETMAT